MSCSIRMVESSENSLVNDCWKRFQVTAIFSSLLPAHTQKLVSARH